MNNAIFNNNLNLQGFAGWLLTATSFVYSSVIASVKMAGVVLLWEQFIKQSSDNEWPRVTYLTYHLFKVSNRSLL